MAGYPTAVGHPNHSGTYIPMLYATMLLVEFYKATVFGAIANTEHEDTLEKFGDTVRIRTLPTISSRDYIKGQQLQYESPEGSYVDLVINRGKYWGMKFNALDKKQIDIDYIRKWAAHASMTQKVGIDTVVLANVYSDAHASNAGSSAGAIAGDVNLGVSGTPLSLTTSNVIGSIVDCGQVLDEQNVPDENRWIVLPAWACSLLKKSDLKDASLTGDGTSVLRNGRLGMIDRFEVYRSNSLATTADGGGTTCTNSIFGHPSAITFASQMLQTETIPNPDDFGQIMRSLQAFGFKTVKSEALGHFYIDKG